MAEVKDVKESVEEKNHETPKKPKKSFVSRIWSLIWLHGDNFEQRLQYISKTEGILLARIKKRASRRRRMARDLIVFSVILEVAAIGYAIMATRAANLDWRIRGLKVLPIFLLPVLSRTFYSGLISFTGMCDRRDQKTLERLRAERQEKIDELKERTNYYTTQQLIQRYDPDPAAKAAAASVLASKLGADSGLHVSLGDEAHHSSTPKKTSEAEFSQNTTGLRRRNQSEARSPGTSTSSNINDHHYHQDTVSSYGGSEVSEISLPGELVVEHYDPTAVDKNDGSWISKLAALLVGDDPSQSYALICGNCHAHNGLARKEEYPFITYYCPHCHSLNKPRKSDEVSSTTTSSPTTRSSTTHENSSTTTSSPTTRDIISPSAASANENLRKESTDPIGTNLSANSTTPETVPLKES